MHGRRRTYINRAARFLRSCTASETGSEADTSDTAAAAAAAAAVENFTRATLVRVCN